MDTAFERLTILLSKWEHLGTEEFPDGTRKIGRISHRAPLAFMHTIFAPLEESRLNLMQQMLGRALPAPIQDFFRRANGFKGFIDSFGMYGMTRSQSQLQSRVRADLLPHDILIPNSVERPRGLPASSVIVGYCSDDGSQVYTDDVGVIHRCSRDDGLLELARWDSFDDWLVSEASRMARGFDSTGRMLS